MYNFDQTFLAKINNIWTGVKGQIIVDQGGWKYLVCKHNGFMHLLTGGYEQFIDDITDEELREYAIKHNTADLDYKIAKAKKHRIIVESVLRSRSRSLWQSVDVLNNAADVPVVDAAVQAARLV